MTKNRIKQIEQIYHVMGILIIVGVFLLKLYTILAVEAPRELREATLAVFVQSFLKGENPYALGILENEIPVATSMYGFIIPLILVPFCFLNSLVHFCGTLQFCQIVTLFVEVIGVYFAYKIVYERIVNKCSGITAAILVYSCYWRYDACGGAFPDQWGMALSIILAYLICIDSKKKYRPILYAVMILILFYIKAYFVFITFGVIGYLWFQSRKDCIKVIVSGFLGGIISFIIVNLVFPLYFSEVLPNGAGQTINGGLGYSIGQIYDLTKRFYLIPLFVIVVYIMTAVYRLVREKEIDTLMKRATDSFVGCVVICILPFTIFIARNVGTNYTYYLQLWYIWVVMFAFECLENVCKEKQDKIMYILKMLLLCGSIVWCLRFMISQPLNRSQINAWEETYAILEEYSKEGDILVSAHLSGWCIDNNLLTAEYGQHEFNNELNLESYEDKIWAQKLFPLADDLIIKALKYNETVLENIQNKKYSCIALTTATNYGIDEVFLESQGYSVLEEKSLATGRRVWATKIYVVE